MASPCPVRQGGVPARGVRGVEAEEGGASWLGFGAGPCLAFARRVPQPEGACGPPPDVGTWAPRKGDRATPSTLVAQPSSPHPPRFLGRRAPRRCVGPPAFASNRRGRCGPTWHAAGMCIGCRGLARCCGDIGRRRAPLPRASGPPASVHSRPKATMGSKRAAKRAG